MVAKAKKRSDYHTNDGLSLVNQSQLACTERNSTCKVGCSVNWIERLDIFDAWIYCATSILLAKEIKIGSNVFEMNTNLILDS